MKNVSKFWGWGFLQAVGASVTVWLWALFMMNVENFVNSVEGSQPLAHEFVIIPIVFMITAVLAAGSVLGWPIHMALKGKWNEAVILTLLTVAWLGVFAIILVRIF